MIYSSLSLRSFTWGVLFSVVGAGACSSGGQAMGRDGSASCAAVDGITVSWHDNGLGHCGTGSISESPGSNPSSRNALLVSGYDTFGNSFGLGLGSLVPGDYSCGGDGGATAYFLYWHQTSAPPEVTQSCSITITSIGGSGGNASGTFSASLAPTEGGTEEISNGMFDGPATVASPI
jgi:hypothetical protein